MHYFVIVLLLFYTSLAMAYHPNDVCSNAIPLTIPSSGVANTAGASTDLPGACSVASPQNGIWFTVVGNGTTLQFSTCDMDGSGNHALQVFAGDCTNLICVGGNRETFCHISSSPADVRWCSEPGVTYYIHLGSESSGDVIAYYSLHSLGACNYVGGNCVPEIVHAPASIAATTDNRDDCCLYDAADQHFLVHIPYDGEWKFIACGVGQPHLNIGSSFCTFEICQESDNIQEPIPECNYGSLCGCMTLAAGDYYVAVETQFDDGEGSDYTFMVLSCGNMNNAPPIEMSQEVQARCASLGAEQTRIITVTGPDINPSRPPIVEILPDCGDSCGFVAGPATWSYDPNAWVFHPGSPNVPGQTMPHWRNILVGVTTGNCCVVFNGFLPVELLDFAAVPADGQVLLHWLTASEENIDKFVIRRDGSEIATILATNSASGSTYSYTDRSLVNGESYNYSLFAVDMNGDWEYLADAEATPGSNAELVGGFALAQNYPNPFNPETTIEYSLAESGPVRLTVYDLSGREVMLLVDGSVGEGSHSVKVDASSLSSGIYFYRLEQKGLSLTKKMVLMK